MSTCQIEVDVRSDSIIVHQPDDAEWCKMAPLRILSFDIECAGKKGQFPKPDLDPVITIASHVTVYGQSVDAPLFKTVFTLNTCAPIVGAQVLSFADEDDLLLAFRKFIQQVRTCMNEEHHAGQTNEGKEEEEAGRRWPQSSVS